MISKKSKVTSKYQTVVPSEIRKALGLKEHDQLVWNLVQKGERPTVLVSPVPKKLGDYLSGLGKEVWQGIDTDAYIRNLRQEGKKEWNK